MSPKMQLGSGDLGGLMQLARAGGGGSYGSGSVYDPIQDLLKRLSPEDNLTALITMLKERGAGNSQFSFGRVANALQDSRTTGEANQLFQNATHPAPSGPTFAPGAAGLSYPPGTSPDDLYARQMSRQRDALGLQQLRDQMRQQQIQNENTTGLSGERQNLVKQLMAIFQGAIS